MTLPGPIVRLPRHYDAARMEQEINALDPEWWIAHPQSFQGNSALLLVSTGGAFDDDAFDMPMALTPALERCPYICHVLTSLGVTIGRTRLMRVAPYAQCPEHIDQHPYWDGHIRLHIPITTNPEVSFFCGYERAHMGRGEVWTFDSSRPHKVVNNSSCDRIHLVCDTVDVDAVLAWSDSDADWRIPLTDGARQGFPVEHDWQPMRSEPDAPIFIMGPPRSGTTLLFEALSQSADLFTIGGESHGLLEKIPLLHPQAQGWDSNRLEAGQGGRGVREDLLNSLQIRVRDRDGKRPQGAYCWLEKTPKNILRIPFLLSLFPRARFVFVHRDPKATISSMIDGWESGRFVTYADLPGWSGAPWSFLLAPGWRDLQGMPLEEVVATQWSVAVAHMLEAMARLDAQRCRVVRYARLCADPQAVLLDICRSFDLRWDQELMDLPLSAHTLLPPRPDKWRRNSAALRATHGIWSPVAERLEAAMVGLED